MNVDIRPARPADLDRTIAIARMWPLLFIERGIAEIARDFVHDHAFVAADGESVIGFSIWRLSNASKELLWLAVEPHVVRRGIGAALVRVGISELPDRPDCHVKVATDDSEIPGAGFDPAGFAAARSLYRKLGFRPAEILRDFFGPLNHVQVFRYSQPQGRAAKAEHKAVRGSHY